MDTAPGDRGDLRRWFSDELLYTPSAFVVLAGAWLVTRSVMVGSGPGSVPFALGNDLLVGIVLATLALVRVFVPRGTATLSLLNLALGVWLIAAPSVLGYYTDPGAAWNDIIVGVLVIFLAGVSWFAERGTRRETIHQGQLSDPPRG